MASCRDCIHYGICTFNLTGNEWSKCFHFKNKADVIEIDKVAEILADITGIAPCEMTCNEWLFDCCEHIGYCCETSDIECWMQYFKNLKR